MLLYIVLLEQGGVNNGHNRRDTMNTIIQTEPIF